MAMKKSRKRGYRETHAAANSLVELVMLLILKGIFTAVNSGKKK